MTIAIHIGSPAPLVDNFNFICFSRIAAEKPEHHFIFIFDTAPPPETYLEPNCTPVILAPSIKNNLLRYYWYNYKIPPVLKKYNAAIFITAGPTCSLQLQLPQIMSISAKDTLTSRYLKKFAGDFFQKARHIFFTSPFAKARLTIGLPQNKTTTLYPGLPGLVISDAEKQILKDKTASGNDYFGWNAASLSFDSIKVVLKAFSIFKQWQHSSMQLIVLVTNPAGIDKELRLYKYREDIKVLISNPQNKRLLLGAYACIFNGNNEEEYLDAFLTMQNDVPVIALDNPLAKTVFNEAATYAAFTDTAISAKLILLYKDEHFRKALISKGQALSATFSWPQTTATVWKTITEVINA
ncbi:MAG: hypothetical protein ABIO05_06100 [Ferruginibacter sp.]